MNLQSETAAEADLHQLLEMAEQHHRATGVSGEFRDSLLQVMSTQYSAESLRLWDLRTTGSISLCAEIGRPESREATLVVRESRTSGVRQLVADGVAAGRVAQIYLSSSDICDGRRLVLELRTALTGVPHQLLSDLCEVFADLHRRRLISDVAQHTERERYFSQLVQLIHADLDENRVANTLASDAAEFLKCRRVSVARRRSQSRWELLAATSVNDPDPRSDAVRILCQLVQNVAKAGILAERDAAAGTATAANSTAPPQTLAADETVLILPLSASQRWVDADWAIIFEQREQLMESDERRYLSALCQHAATALRNCQVVAESSGWSSIRRRLQTFREGKMLLPAAAAGLLLTWLLLRPAELRIEVPGKLIPIERRYVFAPDQGIITTLQVVDGTDVQNGDVLCVLRNDDLELQLERLRGDLAAARARLAALDSLRGDRSVSQSALVSGEQAELNEKSGSLEQQIQFVRDRLSRLTLHAAISGQVHGERIREVLLGRPVARGQYLFEVANIQGPWELELRVAELDVRHVKTAMNASTVPLTVTFALETSPERPMQTTLLQLNGSTDVDDRGQLSTRATAEFPKNSASDLDSIELRPGAGVIAAVHCGKHRAGFVYFRKLIEFIQRRL